MVRDATARGRRRSAVLYLAGIGRSGSTLLERVTGQLPGVVPIGEAAYLWQRSVADDEQCGCGLPFSACPFWTRVGEVAFGGWKAVDVERVLGLAARVDDIARVPALAVASADGAIGRAVNEYVEYYERLYAGVTEVSGCPVVVDSSKRVSLAYALHRSPAISLRVLHVVRDSPGVAYSWTKQVRRPEGAGAASYMPTFSPSRVAMLWTLHNGLVEGLRPLGTPVRRIRYERFVADPVGTLRDVAGFVGLAVDAGDLSFLSADRASLASAHTVSGNPMRFQVGDVPVRRDDSWKQGLPPRQRRMVAAISGPLRLAYGYVGR